MKEIKFRMWQPVMKTMSPISAMGLSFKQGEICTNDNSVLMQYTGLLDAKGKEIWEGDVVQEQYHGSLYVQEIKWSEPNAGFWIGGTTHLNKGMAQDLEVIGNIWENPDLLT